MSYIHAIVAGNSELILYALSLLVGAPPKGVLLLQRRKFGRRGFGRRRRSRGIFGALGALIFLYVVGPIVVLALISYVGFVAMLQGFGSCVWYPIHRATY